MFCVFEGIDGSGKSTLAKGVFETIQPLIQNNQFDHFSGLHLFREPTDLETGRQIRSYLSESRRLPPNEWLELFMKDRLENLDQRVIPALQRGELVLQDRYLYSTAAYQGNRGHFSAEEILKRHPPDRFPVPDFIFYLEISPMVALDRISKGRNSFESFESLDELRLTADNYSRILPSSTTILDATNQPEALIHRVVSLLTA